MRTLCLFLFLSLSAAPVFSADAIATPKVAAPLAGEATFSMEGSGCGGEGHLAEVQCLARYLQWLDGELNRAYASALSKMPSSDPYDDRKSREQLRKSQRAWLKYKADHCTLEGAMEGGSNLWVTHFAAICEERETKQRIRFLRGIDK
jgi:uncharacterized protein YecT (DUF1311 family)